MALPSQDDDLIARVLPVVLLPFHLLHLIQVAGILATPSMRSVRTPALLGFAALAVWFVAATVQSVRYRRMTPRVATAALVSTSIFIVAVMPQLSTMQWREHGVWLGIACADAVIGFALLERRRAMIAAGVFALVAVYSAAVSQIDGVRTWGSTAFQVTASNIPGVAFVVAALGVILHRLLDDRSAAQTALAVARERNRLHRLIHDAALQPLEALGGGWDIDIEAIRANARQQAVLLRTAIREESGLDDLVLSDRLRSLAEDWRARGLSVELDLRADDALVPPDRVAAICMAAGEALMNVTKHAGVRTATISSWVRSDCVHVAVTDVGQGFDPTERTDRLGLLGSVVGRMREVRGDAQIDSAPGRGTTVTMWVPC
jgi:signal transduction histidine kinase